jgi:hypothetical protein
MNRADRTVRLLGLVVPPSRRGRFVEEWQADLAAARVLGLTPFAIVTAAARVAGFLLWIRCRPHLLRRRRRGELLAVGVLLGLALVVTDVPVDAVVPFVLLATGWRGWRVVRAWIDAAR